MVPSASVIARYLPIIEDDLRTVLRVPDASPPEFYHMLHYHMGWVDRDGNPVQSDGGKRIRPVIALLVCESVCGRPDPARPAATAVELIHNFSLLHDDIQDDSPTRRNRPTVWTLWGKANAINAGDAMYTLAFLAFSRLSAAAGDRSLEGRQVEVIGEACIELTRGQHLDMSFEKYDEVSIEEYLDMVRGKTAALLRASAHLGALAAHATDDIQGHYAAFGENLGMAFQVIDDILDIWGDPTVTGKEPAVDIRQRKKSLPVLFGLTNSTELRGLYSRSDPFDDAAVTRAVILLDSMGARAYAADLALMYSERTLMHLEAASPEGDAGKALFDLVDQLLRRSR